MTQGVTLRPGAIIFPGVALFNISETQGIEQLRLDVTTIAGIHGDTADIRALRAVAKSGQR